MAKILLTYLCYSPNYDGGNGKLFHTYERISRESKTKIGKKDRPKSLDLLFLFILVMLWLGLTKLMTFSLSIL